MKSVTVGVPGRDTVTLFENGDLRVKGSLALLQLADLWRPKLKHPLRTWPVPEGVDTGALVIKEAILRLQDQWTTPYHQPELCHCRAVPTEVVHLAILAGAHTPRAVSDETSASTACGTCRPDVEALLKARLSV
jgi:bacterioferritin-associated ferredoxin